eukprot:GHRR01010305.1.p1 GENE.GHRR01010305.1~~GHRR01010305.1.p1  ORF type:complete len:541 (+),score=182.46 GHRR01010305.1:268-1890(+)
MGESGYGNVWDLETALEHVGVGRFQWIALAMCGMANAADAVEILGMSLVLPAAGDDLDLTAAGKSALSSCIFVGMLLGGLLWGPLGDAMGRRLSLVIALAVNASFGMLSAAAQGVGSLVLLRLLAGVGVGGSVPVVFSFLAELLPSRSRGRFMVGLAAHWMVGSIYSAGLGWALIPTQGWRAFLVLAALPAVVAAIGTLLLLPESPRHLLVHNRVEEAEQTLRYMATINRRTLPANITLQHQHLMTADSLVHSHSLDTEMTPMIETHGNQHSTDIQLRSSGQSPNGSMLPSKGSQLPTGSGGKDCTYSPSWHSWLQQITAGLQAAGSTAQLLLRPPLWCRFGPLLIAWIGMCGGWYSTVLWIPEYFKARGAGEASLYAEAFAVAAANLPGNIASIYMVDMLGRRITACVCLAGACVCALAFAAAPAAPFWSVFAACMFNAISVGGWNALDLLSAELFPTEVRSTAMGLLGATGRLAAFTTTLLAGALMGFRLWAPLIVAAGMLAAGSMAMLMLPETSYKPLEDTVKDAAAAEPGSIANSR